jgi:hypothetical protein
MTGSENKDFSIDGEKRTGLAWLLAAASKEPVPTWVHTLGSALTAICLIAIVGITACYTHYAGRQADSMRESLNETRNGNIASNRSSEAALVAARAAETANRMMEDSLRARIVIEGASVPRQLVAGDKASVELSAYNDSKTPARNAILRYTVQEGMTLPEGAMPDVGAFPSMPIEPDAKRPLDISSTIVATPSLLADLQQSRIRIYFYGRIDYETLGSRRYTEFCWAIASPAKNGGLVKCEKWNGSN